jgi:fructosamine-3-kinase
VSRPADVADEIGAMLGARVLAVAPVSGGDLAEAWCIETSDGRRFAKAQPDAPVGSVAVEAAGLAWLRAAGAIAIPEVLAVSDELLVLEWVEPAPRSVQAEERLGRGLAAVHAVGAPAFGATPPGGGTAGFLARLGAEDHPVDDWRSFFVEQRLAPLAEEADRRGELPPGTRGRLDRLALRLVDPGDDIGGPAEPPARLHGDLWGGNVLWGTGDRPWLIDPAAHGGHRETDLAMLRLFGGVSELAFAAYHEVHPLAAGWEDRIGLHQLPPLLVHACLFGGGYGAHVDHVVRLMS